MKPPHRQALATTTEANAAESPPSSSGTPVAEASSVNALCPSFKVGTYDTRAQAWRDIDSRGKRGKGLSPYPCPHCRKFHLTSSERRKGGAR